MVGQFRSSQWDPMLIIAQIVTMQCLFYVGLGTCVAIIDFILGYSRMLGHLFLYQVICTLTGQFADKPSCSQSICGLVNSRSSQLANSEVLKITERLHYLRNL